MFGLIKAATFASVALPMLLHSCNAPDADVALGVLARERVSLTATANEIITALPVAEGERVEVGTILVQLDDRLAQANLEVALANRAQAQADLDRMQSGAREEEIAIAEARVDGARAIYGEAETTVERNIRLLERGAITQASLDQDIARRNSALADLRSAEQALIEIRAGAREEDIRITKAQLRAADARVEAERARLENLTIVASRHGVLDNLPWNLGERVPAGSPVAIVLTGERPFARVYVPEPARARLKDGATVRIAVDGVETLFDGTLRWISGEPAFTPYYALNQEQRSRLVYLAEIDLPPEAADLPVGLPVTAYLP
ncbi:HlyD family secretion protein [Oceanibium sediminis]|uniref:HlyD family secretion protein n=1 Tax=Oceanibium sediminis TaxID=2026339 RepID=UPI000DD4A566|nr:HlyD family efflux transporter periplasmic adaptor subunit [Oceanibium sediminis]